MNEQVSMLVYLPVASLSIQVSDFFSSVIVIFITVCWSGVGNWQIISIRSSEEERKSSIQLFFWSIWLFTRITIVSKDNTTPYREKHYDREYRIENTDIISTLRGNKDFSILRLQSYTLSS